MKSLIDQTLHLDLSYRINDETKVLDLVKAHENDDLKLSWVVTQDHQAQRLKITLEPKGKLELYRFGLIINTSFNPTDRVFLNGYQSWTDSHEHSINDKQDRLSSFAMNFNNKYQFSKYGDFEFFQAPKGRGYFHGYTYAYVRENEDFSFMGSLNERDGFTRFEIQGPKNKIIINKDVDGETLDHSISLDILFEQGKEDLIFDHYFKLLGIKKSTEPDRMGWTSWYNYYQNISETIVLDNLKAASVLSPKMGIFQIDDGYQTAVGDWMSVDKVKFPSGMKYIADSIKSQGSLAGLWMAPLVAQRSSQLVKDHYDWILKDDLGQPEWAGSGWGGFYCLDLEKQEVKDYIRACFDVVLNEWGYDLVKLDFLYAAALGHHPTKTRGQRSAEAMDFIRDCVKDKLILGCGVPLGSAFGLVDYCRIGPDVSLDWKGPWYFELIHREKVSTKNAILNAIGRRHLNHRAFLNDPDVFLLRNTNIQMNNSQKEILAHVNRIFGSLLFTSDLISDYDQSQKDLLNITYALKKKTINSVTYPHKDGVVVNYSEEGKNYKAYINLSSKVQSFETKVQLEPYTIKIISQ